MNPATVKTLLENHSELTDPMRSGNGGDSSGVKLMPHATGCLMRKTRRDAYNRPIWTPAICTCHLRDHVELGRQLETMRVDRGPLHHVGLDRVSLRALRWHIIHRYLRATTTAKTVRILHGKTVGIVEKPDNPTSRVTPLTPHQEVIGKPTGWETHLAEQRQKRSKNSRDMRVLITTWHHDVRPELVEHGIVWIAHNWATRSSSRQPENIAA